VYFVCDLSALAQVTNNGRRDADDVVLVFVGVGSSVIFLVLLLLCVRECDLSALAQVTNTGRRDADDVMLVFVFSWRFCFCCVCVCVCV